MLFVIAACPFISGSIQHPAPACADDLAFTSALEPGECSAGCGSLNSIRTPTCAEP
jgi:hypothetical protein